MRRERPTDSWDWPRRPDAPPVHNVRGMSWWVVGAMCAAFAVIAVAVAVLPR